MFNKINSNCRQLPPLPSVKSVRQFYVLWLTRELQMRGVLVSTSICSDNPINKDRFRKTVVPALNCGFHAEWVMSDFPQAKENICSQGFLAENLVNANLSSSLCRRSFDDVCLHQAVTNFTRRTGRKNIIERGISRCQWREIFNVCQTAVWSKRGIRLSVQSAWFEKTQNPQITEQTRAEFGRTFVDSKPICLENRWSVVLKTIPRTVLL